MSHSSVEFLNSFSNIKPNIWNRVFSQLQNNLHKLLIQTVFINFILKLINKMNSLNPDHKLFMFRKLLNLLTHSLEQPLPRISIFTNFNKRL